MPRKYQRRRRKAKRKGGRRRKAKVARSLPIGLPNKYTCKLRYADFIELNPTTGSAGSKMYNFRCNSVYDPDYTSTLSGHQPMEFDTLASAYRRYMVKSSKIIVKGFGLKGTTPTWLALTLEDHDTAKSSSLRNLIENGASLVRIDPIGYNSSGGINQSFGYVGNQTALQKVWKQKKMTPTGLRGGEAQNASVAANPTEMALFRVTAMNADNQTVSDPAPLQIMINIIYTVTFFDEKQIHPES